MWRDTDLHTTSWRCNFLFISDLDKKVYISNESMVCNRRPWRASWWVTGLKLLWILTCYEYSVMLFKNIYFFFLDILFMSPYLTLLYFSFCFSLYICLFLSPVDILSMSLYLTLVHFSFCFSLYIYLFTSSSHPLG